MPPRNRFAVPLRGLFVLSLLIAAMAAMLELKSGARDDVSDAVTFAAVGFVVLAAYAMAELASSVGLPRVTGYILAGIGLGPSAAGLMGITPLLPAEAVADMSVFKSLALALIALEAGLELSLDAMKRFKKTIGSIILFKIPMSWIFVGGAVVLLGSTIFPIPGVESLPTLIAVGLVLGAISVGTSPAVSVAVISETGAKGKTADLVLGFAVFKDVVMVIMLGLAIALGSPLATGADFDGAILVDLLKTIVVSVIVGVAVGWLLVAWMRWVRWENILMLLALAYGIHPIDSWFTHELHIHLKPLLVFIAAGFVVGNFSTYGHDLHKPLALLALPVFVIFFTTEAAGLELEATIAVLPIAASLFVVRLGVMYFATRFGGRLAGEKPEYTNALWLGLISQAGVALVLLGLAIEQMPTLKEPLQQVGFALIALNLLIGPVLLRIGLKKGEDVLAKETGAASAATGEARSTAAFRALAAEVTIALDDPAAELHEKVRVAVAHIAQRAVEGVVTSWEQAADAREGPDALEPIALTPYAAGLRRAARELRDTLIELPLTIQLPIRDEHLVSTGGLGSAVAVAVAKLGRIFGKRRRTVGLRSLVRAHIERDITEALAVVLDDLGRAELNRLDALDEGQRDARSHHDAPTLPSDHMHIRTWAQEALEHFEARVHATVGALARALDLAGTPRAAAGPTVYADVAREVDRSMGRLETDGIAWDRAVGRLAARAALREKLIASENGILANSAAAIDSWNRARRDALLGQADQLLKALEDTRTRLRSVPAGLDPTPSREAIAAIVADLDTLATEQVLPAIGELRTNEGMAALRSLEGSFGAVIPDLPATIIVAPVGFKITPTTRPSDVTGDEKNVASIVARFVSSELNWSLAETRAEDEDIVVRVAQRVTEIVGSTTVGLIAGLDELAARDDGHKESLAGRAKAMATHTLDRAITAMHDIRTRAATDLETIPRSILASVEDTFQRIYQRVLGEPGEQDEGPTSGGAAFKRRVLQVIHFFERAWNLVTGWWVARYRAVIGSDLVRRARLQTGTELVDPTRMAADVNKLKPSQEQLSRMPFVLARLFTPGTADTTHLLCGVDKEVKALSDAFARFSAGTPTAVLVRGDSGSGKTSMARVTLRQVAGRRLIDLTLGPEHRTETALCEAIGSQIKSPGTRTFRALERALGTSDRVILLDGLEQIFVRHASGVALMRSLLALIAATRGTTFWVGTIQEPAARLLEHLTDIPAFFTDHVRLEPQTATQLGTLLETRCRLSGFDIVWPETPEGSESFLRAMFRRRRPTTDELRGRFLTRLVRLSGGSIRDTLNLFINAIEDVGIDNVRPDHPRTPSLGWFDQLGRDAHRLLAAVIISGTLTAQEAREALLFSPGRIAAARALLLGAGLVVPVGEGDRVRVLPYAWRRARDLLLARNELVGDRRTGRAR